MLEKPSSVVLAKQDQAPDSDMATLLTRHKEASGVLMGFQYNCVGTRSCFARTADDGSSSTTQ